MKQHSILIVDDDEKFLEETSEILSSEGYGVLTAATGKEAARLAQKNKFALALLDKKLPDIDGHELADKIRKLSDDIAIIMITAYGSTDSTVRALRDGLTDYITKPASVETILERVKTAFEARIRGLEEAKRIEKLGKDFADITAYAHVVLDVTPSGVFTVDKEKRVTSWNMRAAKVTGYSAKEVVGKKCTLFAEEPCRGRCGLFFDEVKKPVIGRECTIRTKDGRRLIISKNVDYLKDADGNVVGGVESFEDITARKDAERKLKDSEERFRMLFDSSLDGIMVADLESGKFLLGNGAICRMLGYSPDEIAKLGISDIHPEKDLPHVMEQFEAHAMGELKIAYDLPVKRRDGSVFYADINSVPVSMDGRRCMLGAFRDITERKKMMEAIHQSEKKYRNLLSVVPGIVYVAKLPLAGTLYISDEVEHSLGFTPSEWLSDRDIWTKQIHPLDAGEIKRAIEDASAGSGEFNGTYRMFHKDGKTLKWFRNAAIISKDSDGQATVTGVMVDITDIKAGERENFLLSRVARDISESVLIADKDGVIIHCNEAAEKMFSYGREKIIGRRVQMFMAETNPPNILEMVKENAPSAGKWAGEVMCRRKDGHHFPVLLRIDPMRDEAGGHIGVIVISMDITEKRLMEDELRRYAEGLEKTVEERTASLKAALDDIKAANKKLEEFDRKKSEFVANVSHELANPLFTIKESLSQLGEGLLGDVPEKAQTVLSIAKDQIARLLRFTQNMLDLSKIESGKMPVNRKKTDIKNLVNNCARHFEGQCRAQNVKIIADVDKGLGYVMADGDMIMQILINLVGNALKYTPPEKCVTVTAAMAGGEILGLLQLNDHRRNRFTPGMIASFEGLCASIGIAVARKNAVDSLKKTKDHLAETARVQAEQLVAAERKLLESKRLSDIGMLAATIAHELRNPLGVIRAAAYNIGRKSKETFLQNHLANINMKIDESDQIIKNLLSFSRLKKPNYAPVPILGLIDRCMEDCKKKYPKWQVAVRKKYDIEKSDVIEADSTQLTEIFSNIFDNAFQSFPSKKGLLELAARLERGENRFVITVCDHGTGIDKKDLDRIFEPFFTTRARGTGLGLSVCKELVKLHGGEIDITSLKGEGSTVTISLPFAKRGGDE